MPTERALAIEAEGLVKAFGDVCAAAGISSPRSTSISPGART